MRRRTLGPLLLLPLLPLLLLTVGVQRASAQQFTVCTPNVFNSCANFMVTTTPMVVSGSNVLQVDLRVRNLQGLISSDNTGGSGIYAIALAAPGIAMFGPPIDFTFGTTATATQIGSPQWGWFENYPNSVFMEVPFGEKGAVVGCQTAGLFDAAAPGPAYFQTCDNAAAAQFVFNTPDTWDPTSLQVGFEAQAASGAVVSCVTNGGLSPADVGGPYPWVDTCVAPTVGPPSTVPEPATVVLLGGGLLGLGAARARRRPLR